MKIFCGLLTSFCVFLDGSSILRGQGEIGPEMNCTAACNASLISTDTSTNEWLVTLVGMKSGTGTDPYCKTCTECRVRLDCRYTGDGYFAWMDDGGDYGFGQGEHFMSWSSTTDCDGDPEHFWLADEFGTLVVFSLYCPCAY